MKDEGKGRMKGEGKGRMKACPCMVLSRGRRQRQDESLPLHGFEQGAKSKAKSKAESKATTI